MFLYCIVIGEIPCALTCVNDNISTHVTAAQSRTPSSSMDNVHLLMIHPHPLFNVICIQASYRLVDISALKRVIQQLICPDCRLMFIYF